jgi:hypothetical protein
MIIIECDQGGAEWHKARAGSITASMFAEVRKRVNGLNEQQAVYVSSVQSGADEAEAMRAAGYKAAPRAQVVKDALAGKKVGDFSDAAKDYAFRLAIERISGEPLDEGGFSTYAMRRGNELEQDARDAHAFHHDVVVQKAGFVATLDGKFGASADGLIGQDGGSEYKCLIDPARIREILVNGGIDEFKDQIQGGMWITGRAWWHFCLYCPALASVGKALTLFVVNRDDDYIEAMEADLIEFDGLVTSYEAVLRTPAAIEQRSAA